MPKRWRQSRFALFADSPFIQYCEKYFLRLGNKMLFLLIRYFVALQLKMLIIISYFKWVDGECRFLTR